MQTFSHPLSVLRLSLRPHMLLILLCVVGRADELHIPADPEQFHLFVLAGQSNMAGRGQVEAGDRELHPRILMFNPAGEWVSAVDPMHFDKPKIVGVGPGRSFAVAYAEHYPDVTIGLIPCAVGGSPIAAWAPSGYHRQTRSYPWDDAIKRVKSASSGGVLKGVLWHQGESDSDPDLASKYEDSLHQLVKRFRRETAEPHLPFIAGQMGQFAERPWTDAKKQVDHAHRTLPQNLHHTGFADSDGLNHKGDEVHFDSRSARTLGRRYFEAFQKTVEKSADTSSIGSGTR